MTDGHENACAQPSTTAESDCPTKNNQTAEDRWVQEALEDDDVREALKVLRSAGKGQSGKSA
jgi:hypothetical protein